MVKVKANRGTWATREC